MNCFPDTVKIHPTAVVSSLAILGENTEIGPYCIVEEGAQLGENVRLVSHVHVWTGVFVGNGTVVYQGAVLGSDPQDLKYQGQRTFLKIGSHCKIREYCTLNRGTEEGATTIVGNHVLTMAYVHVAHDCIVDDHAVLANGVQLGGHVELGKGCVIGGNTAVHQFCKVGAYSFIGGTLKIDRHVPPLVKALGNPLSFAGVNHLAIERNQLPVKLQEVKTFYREMYLGKKNWEELLNEEKSEEFALILNFFRENRGKILGRRV